MSHRSSLSSRLWRVSEPRSVRRTIAGVFVIALLVVAALELTLPGGSAESYAATPTRRAGAPTCQGSARRSGAGHVSFSFSCGEQEDVTGFIVQANRTLRSVSDPSFAFGCERSTFRSFDCADIHSGAGLEGSGVAIISEPLCRRGAHLLLRVTPTLDFEAQARAPFTLKGPC
jgi:hypothetical protein